MRPSRSSSSSSSSSAPTAMTNVVRLAFCNQKPCYLLFGQHISMYIIYMMYVFWWHWPWGSFRQWIFFYMFADSPEHRDADSRHRHASVSHIVYTWQFDSWKFSTTLCSCSARWQFAGAARFLGCIPCLFYYYYSLARAMRWDADRLNHTAESFICFMGTLAQRSGLFNLLYTIYLNWRLKWVTFE